MPVIVVGVDGSPGSQKALRFAVTEARVRGDHLRAITVWRCEESLLTDHDRGFNVHDKELAAAARAAAQSELDGVLAGATVPSTELLVREGDAARVLIDESRDAEMLVVGSRGRGGLTGLLMGSVSSDCVARAHCPVAVVR